MITFTNLGNQGRLGNQLFQLSTVISLACDNDDQYIFPNWEYERFFNLHGCFSTNIHPTQIYREPSFPYTPIPLKETKNQIVDLNGYFQSYKYFEKNKPIITSLLTPTMGFGIQWGHASIHVRRGDYLRVPDCHPTCDMNYYSRAMDMIKADRYIIFSDDMGWCKQNFVGDKFIFSEGKNEVEDLALQLSCEHNIIANSSFSWWGAYLNINPSKKVIAPIKWFGPTLSHDTRDLLPPNWIRI